MPTEHFYCQKRHSNRKIYCHTDFGPDHLWELCPRLAAKGKNRYGRACKTNIKWKRWKKFSKPRTARIAWLRKFVPVTATRPSTDWRKVGLAGRYRRRKHVYGSCRKPPRVPPRKTGQLLRAGSIGTTAPPAAERCWIQNGNTEDRESWS